MDEKKRVQDEEKTSEQLRSSSSHADEEYDHHRPGVEDMWHGTLGGDSANEATHSATALRDVTEEPDEDRAGHPKTHKKAS